MLPIIYEFIKFVSNIFVLGGITCLFNGFYYLAFLMLTSFIAIKIVDSDWAFDKFNFSNHNGVVVMLSVLLMFLNIGAIYQNMKNSPIMIRATDTQKRNYIQFENKLFKTVMLCTNLHNHAVYKKRHSFDLTREDIYKIKTTCSENIDSVQALAIPYSQVPEQVLPYLSDLKTNFKYIPLNISNYNYDVGINSSTYTLLEMNIKESFDILKKIRIMMRLSPELEENKKRVVDLNKY